MHMTINTDPNAINAVLDRGVAEIIDRDDLYAKLASGQQLRIKLGIDPTSPNIHLGRATALWKLRDFQMLGHKIVFIIGDFTGTIGDASDKDSERPMLTQDTVNNNLTTYVDQVAKILDIEQVEVRRNSEWLGDLKYGDIGFQADQFSVNDFIKRELVAKRLESGSRVSLREVLYPLMQGYDSVAIKADVEIGGTDQKFNLLAGRDIQRAYSMPAQNIMTLPLIPGTDGRKMSSSWGNTINLMDEPNDMYGKVMAVRDELIGEYFTVVTRVPMDVVDTIKRELELGSNPKDHKMRLAREIVTMYHGSDAAVSAEQSWVSAFSEGGIPDDVPTTAFLDQPLVDTLLAQEIVSSRGDFRRLLDEGAIKIISEDGSETKVADMAAQTQPGVVYKIGKKRFLKID